MATRAFLNDNDNDNDIDNDNDKDKDNESYNDGNDVATAFYLSPSINFPSLKYSMMGAKMT